MVGFELSSECKPNVFEEGTMDEVSTNKMKFKVSTSDMRDEWKGVD